MGAGEEGKELKGRIGSILCRAGTGLGEAPGGHSSSREGWAALLQPLPSPGQAAASHFSGAGPRQAAGKPLIAEGSAAHGTAVPLAPT